MNARSTRGPLTLVLVGAVSMGLAQPAAPPRPAPELAQIKFFAGAWSCEGNVPASPMAPARKTRTTVAVHADLGGFWYSGTVREEKTAENPHPISGMFHETYDPANKQFMMLWVDNNGRVGHRDLQRLGRRQDRLYRRRSDGGPEDPGRDTFVKKGPAELIHTAEMSMNGQWMTMVEESCKKAPPPPAAKK